jgi:hypothetical protein
MIKNIIRMGHVPSDEETVSEFENLIRKEGCRHVLENNFKSVHSRNRE